MNPDCLISFVVLKRGHMETLIITPYYVVVKMFFLSNESAILIKVKNVRMSSEGSITGDSSTYTPPKAHPYRINIKYQIALRD